METLGVNIIRVYQMDYNRSHAECMSYFSDAGVYVIIGFSSSGAYIDGYGPD